MSYDSRITVTKGVSYDSRITTQGLSYDRRITKWFSFDGRRKKGLSYDSRIIKIISVVERQPGKYLGYVW